MSRFTGWVVWLLWAGKLSRITSDLIKGPPRRLGIPEIEIISAQRDVISGFRYRRGGERTFRSKEALLPSELDSP